MWRAPSAPRLFRSACTRAFHGQTRPAVISTGSSSLRFVSSGGSCRKLQAQHKHTLSVVARPVAHPSQRSPGCLQVRFYVSSSLPPTCSSTTSASTPAREDAQSKTGWVQKIREGLRHYWTGSRLLVTNVKAALLLLRKKLGGHHLSRRERRLLTQTTVDLFRLVPFLAIVIIPFAEFSLPVLLTLFPNMLPSTFEDKIKKEEARRKSVLLKLEMAKFLEDALYLRSLQILPDTPSASTFTEAMKKVKEGHSLETKEILGLSKLFEDKFTLEMLDREQVIAMCKYMGLSRFGTTHYLRHNLRAKLNEIREDDQDIIEEGALDKFTEAEMKQATQVRGMDYKDFNTAKAQMEQWLLLSSQQVPPSLLILSRAFTLTSSYSDARASVGPQTVEKSETGQIALPKAMEEALSKTISALPDQLVTDTTLTSTAESTKDMEAKIQNLQEQIKEIKTEEQPPKEETAPAYSAEQIRLVSEAVSLLFASASKTKKERKMLEQLKERKTERQEVIESKSAPQEDKVVSALESKLDKMITNLDKEINEVDEPAHTLMSIIDTNHDGHISFEEFQVAVSMLKAKYSAEDVLRMWKRLDTNNDGQVSFEQLGQIYHTQAE